MGGHWLYSPRSLTKRKCQSVPTCTEPRKKEVEKAELVPEATRDHQIQDYFQKQYKYLDSCPYQPPSSWGQNLNKKSRTLYRFGHTYYIYIYYILSIHSRKHIILTTISPLCDLWLMNDNQEETTQPDTQEKKSYKNVSIMLFFKLQNFKWFFFLSLF